MCVSVHRAARTAGGHWIKKRSSSQPIQKHLTRPQNQLKSKFVCESLATDDYLERSFIEKFSLFRFWYISCYQTLTFSSKLKSSRTSSIGVFSLCFVPHDLCNRNARQYQTRPLWKRYDWRPKMVHCSVHGVFRAPFERLSASGVCVIFRPRVKSF